MLFIPLLSIFIIISGILNADDLCSTYNDCFNCSISFSDSNLCKWMNGKCKKDERGNKQASSQNQKLSKEWWTYFEKCNDDKSEQLLSIYCGPSSILMESEKEALISLPENNGTYGARNVFCKYIFQNAFSKSTNIKIVIENKAAEISSQIYMQIRLNNAEIIKKSIEIDDYEITVKDVNNIEFYYYSIKQFEFSPFEIGIKVQEKRPNYALYISIGVILIACIICAVFIFIFTQKSKTIPQNTIRRQPTHSVTSKKSKEYERIQKINLLFETMLKPITFTKEMSQLSLSCTICLDNFVILKSEVSLTPCFHLLHTKCLNRWLRKKGNPPKCPNCNSNIFEAISVQTRKQEESEEPNNICIYSNRHRNYSNTKLVTPRTSEISNDCTLHTNNLVLSSNRSSYKRGVNSNHDDFPNSQLSNRNLFA